ncbi:hypothetical protein Poli38472_000468 [Pythium oligandrum]|uniref:FYVE-type domain-containing protein n=1 Tax=Pythium oligandrum TaxID=41045 RepID=A0A8K1CBT2_PYTOL|nr:hypothetical protein Poli38472_000468 [Pythium oligandrum]|eukprot:TMW60426.1 hypothetical protein Poli38472_000468 [Pythium oligandrum]
MAESAARAERVRELKTFIPKGRWKVTTECGICGGQFGYLRPRHHCRNCGVSVCGKHSQNRAAIPTSLSTEKQRVCDVCYPKCEFGIGTTQRRRGNTTATPRPRMNFTFMEFDPATNSTRLVKTDRGGRPAIPKSPSNHRQRSKSSAVAPPSRSREEPARQARAFDEYHTPEPAPAPAAGRRRGLSQPPQPIHQSNQQPPPQRRRSPTQAPLQRADTAPQLPHGQPVDPKSLPFDIPSPRKRKNPKLITIGVKTKPAFPEPASSPDDPSGIVSLGDDFGMMPPVEVTHLVASHQVAGPLRSNMAEISPPSPKKLREVPLGTAPLHGKRRSKPHAEDRKTTSSSTGTISVSESEGFDADKSVGGLQGCDCAVASLGPEACDNDKQQPVPEETTLDDKKVCDGATIEPKPIALYESKPQAIPAPVEEVIPPVPAPVTAKPIATTPVNNPERPHRISVEEKKLMQQILDLESQICDHQMELPALMDEWKRAEVAAMTAFEAARRSKERVQQYEKARAAVNYAIRAGVKYYKQKEYDAAILELTRAAAIERTNAKVWYLLAESRLKVRQFEEAETACRMSLGLQKTPGCQALLGRILQQQGRHDEAIQCYLTALDR